MPFMSEVQLAAVGVVLGTVMVVVSLMCIRLAGMPRTLLATLQMNTLLCI